MKFTAIVCALLSLSGVSALGCDRIIPRANIHKMSAGKLNRYLNAVKKLNEGPRPTIWDNFARKHVAMYKHVHSNPQFLVWHRVFLHEVEEKLREVDSEVRIPYWDWTVYNSNMNEDPVWQIFGRWGEDNGDMCVRQGTFSDFRVLYGDDPSSEGRCIKRNSRFDDSFGGNRDTINRYINYESNFSFGDDLENPVHGLIHNGIGQEFAGHASPADPLFFSHHAFVDKIWFDRQNRHPETAMKYALGDRTRVYGYDKLVYQAYDPTDMCYKYIQDNFLWDSEIKMQSVTINSADVKFYTPLPGNATFKERQDDAQKYITEGVIAPDVNDGPKYCTDGSKTKPVGKIMDIEYLVKMEYEESKSRTKQRETALEVSESNKKCLA